ncbi:sensor histidine kinase [Rudanella lutea]|uniref:sensor histidine kinase n=1 Tax=Rudanella lutea TaxID=451374 RepID=UPI0003A2DAA2|nr:histidine kinase [Rudanella lutea]
MKKWFRVGLHVGLWILFYFGVERWMTTKIHRDNALVINVISGIDFILNVSLFYFFGYFIFPRFLYKKKIIVTIVSIVVVYYLTYLINYFTFKSLLSVTDGYVGKEKTYIRRAWDIFLKDEGGWLGAFTSLRLLAWNYSISLFVPTILLSIKSIRDILNFQRKSAKLEHDKLILERDKLTLERDKLALEQENLQLEVNFLKSQINPHFLFNTLNSVYVDIMDTNEQAAEQVLKLASLMRYGLYESNQGQSDLEKELAYIQNYLDLERIRHGHKVSIGFDQAGNFSGYQIAPLLLISLVENAFKHGVRKSKQAAFIHINASIQDGLFTFIVKNSLGVSETDKAGSEPGGVGLVNTRKRLQILYPDQHELAVNTSPNTYQVTLQLRLT